MTKPGVNTHCVADQYSNYNERIIEVTFPDGAGCLISLMHVGPEGNIINVYRVDRGIHVVAPQGSFEVMGGAK